MMGPCYSLVFLFLCIEIMLWPQTLLSPSEKINPTCTGNQQLPFQPHTGHSQGRTLVNITESASYFRGVEGEFSASIIGWHLDVYYRLGSSQNFNPILDCHNKVCMIKDQKMLWKAEVSVNEKVVPSVDALGQMTVLSGEFIACWGPLLTKMLRKSG